MPHTVDIDLGGRTVSLETGRMAKQANGAVVVRSGDSVVLVTACMAENPKPGAGFFPLTVDYREYTYAAGKIPGGFIKREGRMSEKEILTSRLIDRPFRPLFPDGFLNETQIIAMVLSADPETDPAVLAIVGAGAALAISDIPFFHRAAAVRVGLINGKYIANPTYSEARESKLNIVVAGTDEGIVMVEAGAQQVSEDEVLGAIEFGHECCKKIAGVVKEIQSKCGKPKWQVAAPEIDQALYQQVSSLARGELTDALNTQKYSKLESYGRIEALEVKVLEQLANGAAANDPELAEKLKKAGGYFEMLKERIFRDQMLKDRRRPDGRAFDEIRSIWIET